MGRGKDGLLRSARNDAVFPSIIASIINLMDNFSIKSNLLLNTMENINYVSLSNNQTKTYHDTCLALEAYEQVCLAGRHFSGWMYFKKVGTREYLFHAVDRQNNGKSMGARSAETEAILKKWLEDKDAAKQATEEAQNTLEEQGAMAKAIKLGRFPQIAAKVLRFLDNDGVATRFMVIGTNALYAYEAMAGVRFKSDLTATKDFDLLWDSRQRIVMLAQTADGADQGLMGLLKRVDKSFTRNTERTFQAVNSKGFAIEVLRPLEPVEPPLITDGDRLVPMHLAGLDMLLAVPAATETVIAEDGFPLRIRVPDPAAYVLHKLWVADRPDRRPDKARRDRQQAMAVASLIREQLPNYGFDIDRVQNFPEPLLDYLQQVSGV